MLRLRRTPRATLICYLSSLASAVLPCSQRLPPPPPVQAVELGKPWVLDPVGCGATPVRTAACAALLGCRPTVVRGNASEVMAMAGAGARGKGGAWAQSSG